jgi:hypothetical protein
VFDMGNTRTGALVSLLVCAVATASAEAGSAVEDVLARAGAQARLERPLRATGTIRVGTDETGVEQPIVVYFRPEGERRSVLLALPEAKLRVLVRADGEARLAAAGEVAPATLATEIGETRLRVEDLLPFDPARCMGVHVVDAGPASLTLRCDPAKGTGTAYALTVWKLARDAGTPEQVLYYRGTTSNLVKRLEAGDWADVAGKRRPRRIVVEDYAIGAKDVLSLEWAEAGALDAVLFETDSFAAAPLGDR